MGGFKDHYILNNLKDFIDKNTKVISIRKIMAHVSILKLDITHNSKSWLNEYC